jgi:hypothetical protein
MAQESETGVGGLLTVAASDPRQLRPSAVPGGIRALYPAARTKLVIGNSPRADRLAANEELGAIGIQPQATTSYAP